MTAFFESPESSRKLFDEIESWKGTGFLDVSWKPAVKGRYANCFSYVIQVGRNVGAIRDFSFPKFVVRHGGQEVLERIIECIESLDYVETVWTKFGRDIPEILSLKNILKIGDFVLATEDEKRHHAAIYTGQGKVSHCWPQRGVCEGSLFEANSLRSLHRIWRIMKAND